MNQQYRVAILGCGGRGYGYANLFGDKKEYTLSAFCDKNPNQLEKINRRFHLPAECLFTDEKEFLKEKRADILAICTWDRDHVRQCIAAMNLGYDILLEKPVSDSVEEIKELLAVQKKTRRKIIVCHVMRYSPAIRKADELLSSGAIGKLIAIDHTERVAYWHMAQAYIRLHSSWEGLTHPTILAKCCHDLDLIRHFAGADCDSVSSIGGLNWFRPENAPDGAAKKCLECPHKSDCVYSAESIYIELWKKNGSPEFTWPWNKVSLQNPNTEENLYAGLKESVFGECVFFTGAEKDAGVSDTQIVQMQFANGVTASLKMFFTAQPGRRIQFIGSTGEMVLDFLTDKLTLMPYGKESEVFELSALTGDEWGHGGGDTGLIDGMYDILNGTKTDYTSLQESLESHLCGIAAEKSRRNGGILVQVHPADGSRI